MLTVPLSEADVKRFPFIGHLLLATGEQQRKHTLPSVEAGRPRS